MLGTVLKMLAYTQAPRTMFAVQHPAPAAKLTALPYEIRHGYGPRLAALCAVAVALPLGVWLGRRMEGYPERYREALERGRAPRHSTPA